MLRLAQRETLASALTLKIKTLSDEQEHVAAMAKVHAAKQKGDKVAEIAALRAVIGFPGGLQMLAGVHV